jgi:MSHA pilin protein MshC
MNVARGYSLLELVVTLVIAGILAAVSIPYFTDNESKATWFHEQVKADVRYAQRQAVAQRRAVYVCVSSTQVKVGYDAACASDISSYRLQAPSGVSISPSGSFFFNGLGQPSSGTNISLNIGGKTITVWAETGYVP